MTLPERLAAKIDKTETCWLWTAAKDKGYGKVAWGGRTRPAHRVVYELLVGPIPKGLDLDHLCRNPGCVNPDHLEPVTRRENLLRGNTITAAHAARTHCNHGHPFDEANTGRTTDGYRLCRACHAIAERARRQRLKEAS